MNRQPRLELWLSAAVAAAAFLAFAPALSADFIVSVDDELNVTGNQHVHGLSLANLAAWFDPRGGHFHPLTWLSFAVDHAVWGLTPFGYHLTNVVLHAVAATLCFRLLLALLGKSPPAMTAAAVGALWFAVHPLRVESVAWVTERRDVLSGVFWLLTLLFWVRSRSGTDSPSRFYKLALISYTASLAAKAWGITLPVVLVLVDVYVLRHRASWQRRAAELLPFLALSAVTAILAAFAQSEQAAMTIEQHPLPARLAQASFALVFYPWKTLFPLDLSPLYQLGDHSLSWADPLYLACAAGVIAVTLMTFLLRRKHSGVWAAWASYVVIVSPVLGLLQSGRQITADRYAYLSLIPLTALAAAGLARLLSGRRASMWLTASLASTIALGALAFAQCYVWHDDVTYWQQVTRLHPNDGFLRCGLAQAHTRLGQLTDAAEAYRVAADLAPDKPEVRLNAARALVRAGQAAAERGDGSAARGRFVEARAELAKLLAAIPKHPNASLLMGGICSRLGDTTAAVRHLETAAAGGQDDAWFELAQHWLRASDKPKARAALRKLLERAPDHREGQALLSKLRS
ncbi:MAG: hypothetical protein CMJ85_00785 [Planctomycetes bacterium]|nr:hypothetical protein [Planctomycetota bacterium]MDP6424913.1 tetratricopeptide repeat protein [Planctomycetota bacterium]